MTSVELTEILNRLEGHELPLLSWGVVDGSFSEDEILALIERAAPQEDSDELLGVMIDRGLVVERPGDRFRTRMAETVRLAASLRQLFPSRDWRSAATLVSDYRFLSRPRSVPIRDVTPDSAIELLANAMGAEWLALHEPGIRSVLQGWDMSAFQVSATVRILESIGQRGGTCITAGTGAGKTLAFYLPTLTHLLGTARSTRVPRVVAIYPRTELLRDQLTNLLTLLDVVGQTQTNDLEVGVLYRATPYDRRDAESGQHRSWQRHPNGGLICPIVGCIRKSCGGDYIWPESVGESTIMVCATCGHQLNSLVFVRRRLSTRPPPIVFATTEMVNNNLGSAMRRVFVGDGRQAPEFILLDEIHTYSGTHGAQVANLLRRWQAELSHPAHIVGLSATLADPAEFLARLVGLPTSMVQVVAPQDHEMQESGREYFLALRGDPASTTALLSTTIQTSMLLRRMMDAERGAPSGGVYGTKLFAFTDNLDLVNRLHSQLLDAEGWERDGVSRKRGGSLATLRASGADQAARDAVGQLWDAAEVLGTLHRTVRVGRTTSQDQGVDRDSDVVVATASLEVGFDDPDVGTVLQHKAPRDAAQFLQRRGRAGRDPTMRPWTGVVLSDYGRDRLAFQSYEALFDPLVRPSRLPVANRVGLKMQAAWWITDYLAVRTGTDVRRLMSSSPDRLVGVGDQIARLLAAATELLTDEGINRLHDELKKALRVNDEVGAAVLWDHPRALVTAVIPSIIRRLTALHALTVRPDEFGWPDAMWEYVPRTLFAPLQTPEVRIHLPPSPRRREPQVHPISQTLREFAPGRVNYRFSLRGRVDRMWIQPPEPEDSGLGLDTFCSEFVLLNSPNDVDVSIVQPVAVQLTEPDPRVSDSAFGRWDWQVAYRAEGEPASVDTPAVGPWASLVQAMNGYTHRHRCPLTVWRYAESFVVEQNSQDEPGESRHRLRLDDESVAVGFSMDIDGIAVDVRLDVDLDAMRGTPLARALRTTYFEHRVRTHPVLVAGTSSVFLRDWIAQLAMCVVAVESHDTSGGFDPARISDDKLVAALIDAGRTVFGAADESPEGDPSDPRLLINVERALHRPEMMRALRECLALLRTDVGDDAAGWIRERMSATLAAAIIDAIQAVCPDMDVTDLRPDLDVRSGDAGTVECTIWITEDHPGGTGIIETALDRIIEDPRRFWTVVSSALGPTDGERVDRNLRRYLRARAEGSLSEEVSAVQVTGDLQSTTHAWASLRKGLYELGVEADQTITGALASRLLRPGADTRVEELARQLLDLWDEVETIIGIEVDLRVVAHLAANRPGLTKQLASVVGTEVQRNELVVGQIVGLLWARGSALRSSGLQAYNPYNVLPPTERLLLEHIAEAPDPEVDADDLDWRVQLDGHLCNHGSATVVCRDDLQASLTIEDLLVAPTVAEVLEFHPRVVGVTRSAIDVRIHVDLREAQQ